MTPNADTTRLIADHPLVPPAASLAPHLIPMGTEWALWRLLAVRATGFPIADLLSLAMPACAAAADSVIAKEARGQPATDESRQAAWESYQQSFDSALLRTSTVLYETSQ